MKEALRTLMERLPDHIDGAIITSGENRRYLTGMKSSDGTLLVTRNAACFIVDFRYIEQAGALVTDFALELQTSSLYEQIKRFFSDQSAKKIALETQFVTMETHQRFCEKLSGLQILDTDALSGLLREMRAVKSREEIECIARAQEITDRAFTEICGLVKEGMTELQIAAKLEYAMREQGSEGIAFDTIVVSGPNTALPHGVPSDRAVKAGDFITMDFGALYGGYCSDMTRTLAMGGISEEQKAVYHTVLTAQEMALAAIKPGKRCNEVDRIARDFIDAKGYQGCFGHGLGHSLGLNIHEKPALSLSCEDPIQENIVLTVEPGIYLSGCFGVRIEDLVVVTADGIRNLTKSDKQLMIL